MIRTAEARWSTIGLLLGVQTLMIGVLTAFAFGNPLLAALFHSTGGLLQPTLIYGLMMLTICVGAIIIGHGGLKPADVGLVRHRLLIGVVVTCAIWIASQAILMGSRSLAPSDTPTLLPADAALPHLGAFVAAAGGMALYEEIVFRGFLFPQLYLKLSRIGDQPGQRLALALIASQGLFAILHLPVLLWHRRIAGLELVMELAVLMLVGGIAALIYLSTSNLFIVVGIHSLANAPMPIIHAPLPPIVPVVVVSVTFCLVAIRTGRLARVAAPEAVAARTTAVFARSVRPPGEEPSSPGVSGRRRPG